MVFLWLKIHLTRSSDWLLQELGLECQGLFLSIYGQIKAVCKIDQSTDWVLIYEQKPLLEGLSNVIPPTATCQWELYEVLIFSLLDWTNKLKLFFPQVPFSISLNLWLYYSRLYCWFSYLSSLCNLYMNENDLLSVHNLCIYICVYNWMWTLFSMLWSGIVNTVL